MRGQIDAALTAAFRTVFGWCPEGDGAIPGTAYKRHYRGITKDWHIVKQVTPLPAPEHVSAGDNWH